MKNICELFNIDVPIIQAPMAGVQDHALAVAVSNAGGLGSLPCAMLSIDTLREELSYLAAKTTKPYNVNFFCHQPPHTGRCTRGGMACRPSTVLRRIWRGRQHSKRNPLAVQRRHGGTTRNV